MTSTQSRLFRTINGSIIFALLAQPFVLAQEPTAEEPKAVQSQSGSVLDQLPDSPGAIQTKPIQAQPAIDLQQPVQQSQRVTPPSETAQASTGALQTTVPQQATPHEPVGTAAAESIPVSGVAASRPAGAAVAPAKQRRVRSILIKIGAVVGVGIAVGTTIALSQGSPSKPPGSH